MSSRAKHAKEEILKEKNRRKVTEEYIDALYYHCMYNSDACWKGDPRMVTKELKKLKSKSTKYKAVKENILI